MLSVLHKIERNIDLLLAEGAAWKSKCVDYSQPIVHRIYRDWTDPDTGILYRVYLHKIFPCGSPLVHKHPWPSAIRVIGAPGSIYEMGMTRTLETDPDVVANTPMAAVIRLASGSEYEMVDPHGVHYVYIIEEPSISLMVTGPLFEPQPNHVPYKLRELTGIERISLESAIRAHYRV